MTQWTGASAIKVLLTGADSQVAAGVMQQPGDDFELIALTHRQLDIGSPASVRAALDEHLPDYVVNTAGFNQVDVSEQDQARCFAVNRDGIKVLAQECGALAIPVLHLSTDHVFDGHYASGYSEEDAVSPLGIFGESKRQGEELLRQFQPQHIILRVSWIFSACGNNYLRRVLQQAASQSVLEAADDRQGCPTSAADVGRVILAIIKQLHAGAEAWGTYHYCGAEVTTRYRFTEAILAGARQYQPLKAQTLQPVPLKQLQTQGERPASSVLQCKKLLGAFGIRQHPWRRELAQVLKTLYANDSSDQGAG